MWLVLQQWKERRKVRRRASVVMMSRVAPGGNGCKVRPGGIVECGDEGQHRARLERKAVGEQKCLIEGTVTGDGQWSLEDRFGVDEIWRANR